MKISLKRVNRVKLTFTSIFIFSLSVTPLAAYSLVASISLDRLLLCFALLLFPLHILNTKKNICAITICFSLLLVSLIASLLFGVSSGSELAPMFFLCYVYFFVCFAFSKNNVFILHQISFVLKCWLLILLMFGAYVFYQQYILGNLYYTDPLGMEYSDPQHRRLMMGNKRFFLPYASAPFLGFVAGFIFLWFFCVNSLRGSNKFFICFLAFLVLLLSMSRGPLYALIGSALFVYLARFLVANIKATYTIMAKIIFCLFMGVCFLLYILLVEPVGLEYAVTDSRLMPTFESIVESRHMVLRLDAIGMFLEASLVNKLFGSGLGFYSLNGEAPYSFMSYLTILVEMGIFGLVAFILPLLLSMALSLGMLFSPCRNARMKGVLIFSLILYVATCHMFYEYKTFVPIWIVTGLILGLVTTPADTIFYRFHRSA